MPPLEPEFIPSHLSSDINIIKDDVEHPKVLDSVTEGISHPVAEIVSEAVAEVVSTVAEAVKILEPYPCTESVEETIVPVTKTDVPSEEVAPLVNLLNNATEYVASFSVAQTALKASDSALGLVDSSLQTAGVSISAIQSIRRHARAVKRAGARKIEPVSCIEDTIAGSVVEKFGFNFFLSLVGLKIVPTNLKHKIQKEPLDEEWTINDLENEELDSSDSDEDPDYCPSDASEDPLEYASDTNIENEKIVLEEIEGGEVAKPAWKTLVEDLDEAKLADYNSQEDEDYCPNESSEDGSSDDEPLEYASDTHIEEEKVVLEELQGEEVAKPIWTTLADDLAEEKLAKYDSKEDSDYCPGVYISEDTIEYDSNAIDEEKTEEDEERTEEESSEAEDAMEAEECQTQQFEKPEI